MYSRRECIQRVNQEVTVWVVQCRRQRSLKVPSCNARCRWNLKSTQMNAHMVSLCFFSSPHFTSIYVSISLNYRNIPIWKQEPRPFRTWRLHFQIPTPSRWRIHRKTGRERSSHGQKGQLKTNFTALWPLDTTYPAPNSNSVFVNKAKFDEFPGNPNGEDNNLDESSRRQRWKHSWLSQITVKRVNNVSIVWDALTYLAAVIWSSTS